MAEIVDAVERDQQFAGITVIDSRGFGREKSARASHSSAEELSDFVERVTMMVAAPDDLVEQITATLERVARTGRPGDGKIFVVPMESAIRMATGERDRAALR